jgi:hypothetical protein
MGEVLTSYAKQFYIGIYANILFIFQRAYPNFYANETSLHIVPSPIWNSDQ